MERIPYALGVDGETVHISEVRHSGLSCQCRCPHCGAALEAVNVENPAPLKAPHFRHYELTPGTECAEQAAGLGLSRILAGLKAIHLAPHVPLASPGEASMPTAVSRAQRVDSDTVRLYVAGGGVVEIHLQRRKPRDPPDWERLLAVLELPISASKLLSMAPERAIAVLGSAAAGRWRTAPPAPAAEAQAAIAAPAASASRGIGTMPLPVRRPDRESAPHPASGSWGYRWRDQAPSPSTIADAKEIACLIGGAPAAVDSAVEQLLLLQRTGNPVSASLDLIAAESGLERSQVRDLAQHAQIIAIDSRIAGH